MMTQQTDSGPGAYELGRMVEALAQNTRTIHQLSESVSEMARVSAKTSERMSRMEDSIERIESDLRKTINLSMTGHTNESEVRDRLAYLDRLYKADQDKQGLKKHAKNVLAGAIAVAIFWWGFAVFKDALVREVRVESHYQAQR